MPQEHPQKKLSGNESLKAGSHGLTGTIADELGQAQDHFSEASNQLLKHHGTYQQDDRDVRIERKKQGLDKLYFFMVRTKFPGGSINARQYLLCDDLCTHYGQDDLRVTSRQGFQFHGVVRQNLRNLIHDLNMLAEVTTLGACGDVVRNTMAPPVADIDPRYEHIGSDLIVMAQQVSDYFLPKTTGYYDIWINDQKATVHEDGTVTFADSVESTVDEPIYGTNFLPRKFKIAIGADFDNSVDLYANDIGVMAVTKDGRLEGFEILVGGGLGHTHKRPETYPRVASPLCFVEHEADVLPVLEAIVKVQRDFGDRTDRRHARMKYLIDDQGEDWFRAKVFEYAGREYAPPRRVTPSAQPHYLGWHKQIQPGLNYVCAWIENGRIRDFEGGRQFKAGLRAIVENYQPDVRLTAHHNLILANIKDDDVAGVQALLDEYQIPTDKGISVIRRLEMACPALPLCGLALSESERAMPAMMEAIEAGGHADADVLVRMSGCPNSCSRPVTAEIGIIGRGRDQYQLLTGGDYLGTRLTQELIPILKGAEVAPTIVRLLDVWKAERHDGERFGDWSHRSGAESLRQRLEESAPSGA
jgi:sulfite reductase (ferredoxin)